MNSLKAILLTAFMFAFVYAQAGTPIKIMSPVKHVYVPQGLDSNDNSEVVIQGLLPNLCHKSPESVVKKDGRRIDIVLTALLYEESNPFCPEVVVPYIESVSLGMLEEGDYEIVVNGGSLYETRAALRVERAPLPQMDNFIYARVEYIHKIGEGRKVILRGENPSPCFELDRIEWISNGSDTYSILPILRKTSEVCAQKMVPFDYEFDVPEDIKREEVLLHVRSMDGRSVNSLFLEL